MPTSKTDSPLFCLLRFSLALLCQKRTPPFLWWRFTGILACARQKQTPQPYLTSSSPMTTFIRICWRVSGSHGNMTMCWFWQFDTSVGSALQSTWRRYRKRKPWESKKDRSPFLTYSRPVAIGPWNPIATGSELSKMTGESSSEVTPRSRISQKKQRHAGDNSRAYSNKKN